MNITPSEVALILIVALDVIIVGALIVVRVMGLRGGRASSTAAAITPEDQAPDMDSGRRIVRPSAFTTSVTPAAAPVSTSPTSGTADPSDRSEHPAGSPVRPTAAAEGEGDWQLALRRESARAGRYGRSMTLMQFEIDQPADVPAAAGQLAEADALLAGLIAAHVRVSDHVAHPSPGRYWLLLTETDERAALWVADRIRGQFVRRRPSPPGLLVGWAGTEPGGGVETSLRRAAERVHEDRRRVRAGFEQAGPIDRPVAPPAAATPDDALTTLERLRKAGFVTDEEYREKRSDILRRV